MGQTGHMPPSFNSKDPADPEKKDGAGGDAGDAGHSDDEIHSEMSW